GDSFSGVRSRVAGENVGIYAIQQGTLTAGGNYNLTFAGANLTITARAMTVTADAKTKAYGDVDPALTYSITSGSLKVGDSFTGSLTRNVGESVGSYAINKGTLPLSTNHTLTFIASNLAITPRAVTITADAKTKTYGASDPALSYSITAGTLKTGDTFSGSLTREPGETIGDYAIQLGAVSLGSNYNLTFAGANLTITARAITVTAGAKTKTYGASDPALTYLITSGSLKTGDSFTGNLTRQAGEDVGSYAIQQGTLALNSNYNLTFIGSNLTITPRTLTVTADNKVKTYGDPNPALTASYSGFVNGDTDTILSGAPALSTAATATSGVGSYPITVGAGTLSAANYSFAFVNGALIINKAMLT